MQPAPAHMSGVLSDLWQDVVSAADVADLAQKFSAFRLDLMPHFAAFFWADDGMHSLIRGNLRALDAETGLVVADGEGFHTWNEVGLQSVRQVRVDMDPLGDEPVLALPLAVGVVLASSITVDSTEKVPLRLPLVASAEIQPPEPLVAAPSAAQLPADDEAAASDEAHEAPAAFVPVVPVPSDLELLAAVAPIAPVSNDAEPVDEAPTEEGVAEHAEEAQTPGDEAQTPHDEAQTPHDEAPADENLDDPDAASALSEPAHSEPEEDAWGVRSSEALSTVDLFVDEDGDGIPDAQQHGLDLDGTPALALVAPVGLEVAAPEAPQAEADQVPQNPYRQQQPGGYESQQQPAPTGMPFAPPGLQAPQYPPAPVIPGAPFPGQAYPGQPYPGQPFTGQAQPAQYSAQQQPTYQEGAPYGAPTFSSGAPLSSPLVSPVPLPRGSAPAAPSSQALRDAPPSGTDNLIMAVMCSFGHPNPPGSPRCRRCGQPVDNANPRPVQKPALAQLITAGGARVDVTDTVLIGRAPSAQAGDGHPILLPIPSPNSDISRTHLRVAVKEWDIVATDLHSTNGTMLVRPGQAPVRMMPGTPVTVEPGTILDLGDGGVITVGLPV
jgi:hypothetical protein